MNYVHLPFGLCINTHSNAKNILYFQPPSSPPATLTHLIFNICSMVMVIEISMGIRCVYEIFVKILGSGIVAFDVQRTTIQHIFIIYKIIHFDYYFT